MEKIKKVEMQSDAKARNLEAAIAPVNPGNTGGITSAGFSDGLHISNLNTGKQGYDGTHTRGRMRTAETMQSGHSAISFQPRSKARTGSGFSAVPDNQPHSLAAYQTQQPSYSGNLGAADPSEQIMADRSGIMQVSLASTFAGTVSPMSSGDIYEDSGFNEEVTYEDLLYYLLQCMYLQRLMEQMQEVNPAGQGMPYLTAGSFAYGGMSGYEDENSYIPLRDSMDMYGMGNQMPQSEDNGAITYMDLFLSTMEVSYFVDVKVTQAPGEHASLYVKAVLDSDMDENGFHGISDEVSLQYWKDGEAHVLFYGIVDNLYLDRDGDEKILTLTAGDATTQMDIGRQKRIFQNPDMGVHQLVEEIMKTYSGSDYKVHIPDEPIGQVIVQYEETDWEFLKRFLSKYHEMPYSDTTYPDIRFEAGLAPQPEDYSWDDLPYVLSQDLSRLVEMKLNGMNQLTGSQNTVFEVTSYDVAKIGCQVIYKGLPWFVESTERYMEKGLLKNKYRMRQKESLKVLPYFNQNIAGVSIDGLIANVQRDRVQVEMEIAAGDSSGEKYWFPFSTVAASSDGSGWYCMPENGESVRVYFPTDDEKEAYVVTAIKSHEPDAGNANDPMGNPDVRNIQTAQGNQVQFTDIGVVIAAGEGNGSILVKKSGEIVLDALMDIRISAVENLNIAAMNELTIKSLESIKVASSAGGDIEIKKGTVTLHGKLINEN